MKNLLLNLSQNIIKSFEVVILFSIKSYQVFLSSFSMPTCKYSPTCSCYAQESIRKFGSFKGLVLTLKRILKCHPFVNGGYDPVPKNFHLVNPNFILRGNND